jgi:hypothetical protein
LGLVFFGKIKRNLSKKLKPKLQETPFSYYNLLEIEVTKRQRKYLVHGDYSRHSTPYLNQKKYNVRAIHKLPLQNISL